MHDLTRQPLGRVTAGTAPAASHSLIPADLAVWAGGAAAAALALYLAWRWVRYVLRRVRYGWRPPRLSLWLRLRWRLNPGPGFANDWQVWRRHGLPAARKVARTARPSLTWADRRRGSWRQYAAFLGWAQGWLIRHRVYAHVESLRLVIAPPQQGKSADAAGTILDAPGPVVATSIRGDLIALTAGLRSAKGAVHVWNPEEVGDFASTFAWNPVAGCEDMVTAVRRAGYMIEATTARGLADETFWTDQASMVLAAVMHAAGLAGGDMRHVYRWILENDQQPDQILADHPGAADTARTQYRQYRALPERTRAGISATINSALRFMQDPRVVASLLPAAGEGFDFTGFLLGDDTLYLVAGDAQASPVPPLFVCICAELTDAARRVGGIPRPARLPRRALLWPARLAAVWESVFPPRTVSRLDPPLTMVLDEVALIAPVPVAGWAPWAAGSGIWLHLYAQAWAQLEQRWGEHGAAVIWQACRTKVIYTGTSEPELGQMVEDLCGRVRVRGPDDYRLTWRGKLRRRPTSQDVPVLPASALRQLPPGRAVVLQGSAPPTIVRTERVWRRADYRDWRRQGGTLALPSPSPASEPSPSLLATAGRPRWPGDGRAARHGRGQPRPGEPASPAPPAAPGGDRGPEAMPPGPARPPQPPARPAPWLRPGEGDGDR